MAKNNSSNIDITIDNLDGFSIKAGGLSRVLGVQGGNVTLTGGSVNTYSYPNSPYINLVGADTNGNPNVKNIATDFTSTVTSGGTVTLVASSTRRQLFTGTSNHTVVLPNASGSLIVGHPFVIHNESTGAVTIQTNGGATLTVVPPNSMADVFCTAVTDAPGTWDVTLTATEGTINAEQYIIANTAVTLANQTAAQKMFSSPTNGAVTVAGSTTYFFECSANLLALTTASASFGFAIGGTATFSNINWHSYAIKPSGTTTVATAGTMQTTYNTTAANTAIVTAGTATTSGRGYFKIHGVLRVNAGGTVIPQVSVTAAVASSQIGAGSYFRIWKAGTASTASLGAWT